ncbi:MAG: class I SAM-dependent methyltransferase [Cyanobacteria bacterium J06592_8]
MSFDFPETADIETASSSYASRFSGAVGTWMLNIQTEATLAMLQPYPQATILDVGGGHGQLTAPLIAHQYQLTVLGSSKVCQERIQPWVNSNRCTFQVGNVLNLPYPDHAFDVVVSYRFLAHVNQWQKFLSELTRVAKKAIIIDYPTVHSVNAIAPYLFSFKKRFEGNTRQFTCYQEAELHNFLNTLGLQLADRYPQFFFPMVFHRILKSPNLSSTLEQSMRSLKLTHFYGSPVIAKFTKG